MIQPEEEQENRRVLSTLHEHAPRPNGVAYQSFREKVTEDVAQTLCDLRVVRVLKVERNGMF
jgi:hypothetical protein